MRKQNSKYISYLETHLNHGYWLASQRLVTIRWTSSFLQKVKCLQKHLVGNELWTRIYLMESMLETQMYNMNTFLPSYHTHPTKKCKKQLMCLLEFFFHASLETLSALYRFVCTTLLHHPSIHAGALWCSSDLCLFVFNYRKKAINNSRK